MSILSRDPVPLKGLLRTQPDEERQATMMDHVQGGEVGELLPQHKEERVEEVHELRDEVPPGHVQGCQPSVAR
jgi:hypothetical protein